MRRVSVACLLAAVALVFMSAGPAHAQGMVVAAGWSPSWVSSGGSTTKMPVGLMFNVAGSVVPMVQVVGDLGYLHKDQGTQITGMGGIRIAPPAPGLPVSPFVEGLVGAGYLNITGQGSHTGLGYGAGAGFDFKPVPIVGLRVQADWLHFRHFGVGFNEFRIGVGISLSPKI